MANKELSKNQNKFETRKVTVVSTCPWLEEIREVLSKLNELKTLVEELRNELRRTGEPKNLDELLEQNSELLFKVERPGLVEIRPRKFLGDKWKPLNEQLRSLGFTWISKGKQSCWEKKEGEVTVKW